MGLPSDIQKLIAEYMIKPIYILDSSIKGIDKYIKTQLNMWEIQEYLLYNPLIIQTNLFNGLYKLFNNDIALLPHIHSPLAIKRIMKINNWAHELQESDINLILDELLENPYAGPILDKFYEKDPKIFYDMEPEKLLKSKSAANIIISPDFMQNYPMKLAVLLTNPSELVFEKLQLYELNIANGLYGRDNIRYLLANPNQKLLSLAVPHIKKFINKATLADRALLELYADALASNHTLFASELLNDILNSVKYLSIDNVISGCINFTKLATNPSDYMINSIIEYSGPSPTSPDCLYGMRHNENPKALHYLKSIVTFDFLRVFNDIAANPGAITLIKAEPEKFMVPHLAKNPAIFVPITNNKLVNRVCKLIEF